MPCARNCLADCVVVVDVVVVVVGFCVVVVDVVVVVVVSCVVVPKVIVATVIEVGLVYCLTYRRFKKRRYM